MACIFNTEWMALDYYQQQLQPFRVFLFFEYQSEGHSSMDTETKRWYTESSLISFFPVVSLTVSLRQFNPPGTYEPVVMFSLTEGTIDRWFMGQFDIQSETKFQILFLVSGESGGSADTAIDDTSITTSLCQGKRYNKPNPLPTGIGWLA